MENRRGFTLIEIVIVTIVVGILASVAVATQRSFIERGRGSEARQILLSGYAGYQRLIAENEPIDSGHRLNWSRMGMSDPNLPSGRYFNYSIEPNTFNPQRLEASRGVSVSGCMGASVWDFRLDLSTGKLTEDLS